jgi:transcription antitermination protein NusB
MSIRRKAREIALQVLYQLDIDRGNTGEVLRLYWENFQPSEKTREFCQRLVEGVQENRGEIDQILEKTSDHWALKRMAAVDRSILRLAAFELLYCPDIPFKVTLNEAIELAKKFSTDESSAFINGLLDKVHSSIPSKEHPLSPKIAES